MRTKTREKGWLDRRIGVDLKDPLRSGRCWRCGRLYRWKPGRGRELRIAHCTKCGDGLAQTTAANLAQRPKGSGYPRDLFLVDHDPEFRPPAPCGTDECRNTTEAQRKKLCWICEVDAAGLAGQVTAETREKYGAPAAPPGTVRDPSVRRHR